jgi:3-hydroxyacyl-CoA dehydrogenase
VELNDETLARGRTHLQHSTDRAVKRGKLTAEDQDALLGRITFTTAIEEVPIELAAGPPFGATDERKGPGHLGGT